MASTSKISKLDAVASAEHQNLSIDLLSDFHADLLSTALHKLCSARVVDNIKLVPCKLNYCNAGAINGVGMLFSQACCDFQSFNRGFFLGDIFRKGLDIGVDFLDGKVPEEKLDKILLLKLVNFIISDEKLEVEFDNETDRTVVLANHLFAKLAISSDFTTDSFKTKIKGMKCRCTDESCLFTGKYGDTSIGNPKVWHGSVDVIIRREIVIENLKGDDDDEINSHSLTRNGQLVAQTIVFSFLQKKRHPEWNNFLIPCIGIGDEDLLIMFYDSEHDILLESSLVPLYSKLNKKKYSVEAIVVTWLVVNYNFLCTGLTNEMHAYKADFFAQAKSTLDVYENELTIQDVEPAYSEEIVLPSEWDYNEYLLEKNDKIDELNRKRRYKTYKVEKN